ncbi:hypothetical protein ACH5RR_003309, partial [Cinchona calisaya]
MSLSRGRGGASSPGGQGRGASSSSKPPIHMYNNIFEEASSSNIENIGMGGYTRMGHNFPPLTSNFSYKQILHQTPSSSFHQTPFSSNSNMISLGNIPQNFQNQFIPIRRKLHVINIDIDEILKNSYTLIQQKYAPYFFRSYYFPSGYPVIPSLVY